MTGGKQHHNFRDLSGQQFGMLTALAPSHSDGKKWLWFYECECGIVCVKYGQEVTKTHNRGRLANCGCRTKDLISKATTRHGMSAHPAYSVWRAMLDRCRLPSHQAWANYGERGISVCERWQQNFQNFWDDMGPGYRPGLEIDRRDNNGNYSAENCRWATCMAQANNQRRNVRINTPAGRLTVAQASRLYKIGKTTLHYRIANNWPEDKLLISPDFHNRESTTCSTAGLGTDL